MGEKENEEKKEDVDDKEHEKTGQDGEGRSEETTEGEIDTGSVEAKVDMSKERPEKNYSDEDERNVSNEGGKTKVKGNEDSLGVGVVIEQTITVHADGDIIDKVLEGRHDSEAKVIDSADGGEVGGG